MDASELLEATVGLFEALHEVHWNQGIFQGTLVFEQRWIPVLEALEDDDRLLRLFDGSQSLTVGRAQQASWWGRTVTVEVDPPSATDIRFVRDIQSLLAFPKARHRAPASFYLADEQCLYPRDSSPTVQQYLETIEFVSLVRGLADHEEERPAGLVLVILSSSTKLEIPVVYGPGDIVSVVDAAGLTAQVLEAPYEKIKQGFLRNSVLNLTSAIAPADRLPTLLRRYVDLEKQFSHNLELYLNEFSFETELERIETQKREYLLKINAAVGDIHAKLIAIPVAVVLVAGQMKPVESAAVLIANLALLAGAITFAVLMWMLAANQAHSLEAIQMEFVQRKDRLSSEVPKLYREIEVAFTRLEERYRHQHKLLGRIKKLVGAALAVSVVIFLFYLATPWSRQHMPSRFRGATPPDSTAPVRTASPPARRDVLVPQDTGGSAPAQPATGQEPNPAVSPPAPMDTVGGGRSVPG